MEVMLPTLGEERQQTYSPFLPICPRQRQGPAGAGGRTQCRGRHHRLPGRRRCPGGNARYRRPGKAAMEGRLGHALVCAGCRLRDVRQGPDPQLPAGQPHLPHHGRHAADEPYLRAVSRRQGPEDLEVQGQWSGRRGLAALCAAGKPVAVHVSKAESGQAALFRRHPAHRRRLSDLPRKISGGGRRQARWTIRSGTSITAHPPRRRPDCPTTSC